MYEEWAKDPVFTKERINAIAAKWDLPAHAVYKWVYRVNKGY